MSQQDATPRRRERRGRSSKRRDVDSASGAAPTYEFAWRVNDGINDWTARVDGKASTSLAIEAAVAAVVVLLATGDGELAHAHGLTGWILGCGVAALALAVLASVAVVFPQLRGFSTRKEYRTGVIYFGHLRHWDPGELARHLEQNPTDLAGLSQQLVRMSKITWRKHRWLQWSLALFVIGMVLVASALIRDRLADPLAPAGAASSVVATTPSAGQ